MFKRHEPVWEKETEKVDKISWKVSIVDTIKTCLNQMPT